MDLGAQPLLDDEPGMYPMPMIGEALGGPENAPAPNRDPSTPPPASAAPQATLSPYELPPAAAPERKQEPLRTLPAPPPILDHGSPAWAPPMRPPVHHHPQHGQTVPPQHHHAMPMHPHHHRRAMHGMSGGFGDDTPQSASNLLGLALVTVPVGGYVGYRYAGALGILGGMLAAGGLVNGVRAARGLTTPPADPSETWISATFAVLGLGAAAYLLYRGHGSKGHVPNKTPDDDSQPNPRRL